MLCGIYKWQQTATDITEYNRKTSWSFYWRALFTQVAVLSVGNEQKESVSQWKKNYSVLKQYNNITQIWKQLSWALQCYIKWSLCFLHSTEIPFTVFKTIQKAS
jgi:hypothetical protein